MSSFNSKELKSGDLIRFKDGYTCMALFDYDAECMVLVEGDPVDEDDVMEPIEVNTLPNDLAKWTLRGGVVLVANNRNKKNPYHYEIDNDKVVWRG